ncbi:MAG: hypothetical protein ACFNZS_04380 [Ottowia sp.]
MKPETGHLEGPNWDTPPNGDFAAYVQRLTAPAALVKPAPFSPPVLIQAQTSPQKTAQQKKNRPKPPALAALRKLPSRRQRHVWLATAFTFAGLFLEFIWLVLKFLLNIGLLFVPGGGLLSAILEQRKKPQQLRHWGVIVFLSALLSLLLGMLFDWPGALAGLLIGALWLLWSYRHTRFVQALGAAWQQWLRRFSDPPNPV